MSDSAETADVEPVPDTGQPVTASAGAPPIGSQGGGASDHPELLVGAAFAGCFLLATILKHFAD
jgi:organic hydroperoxide reductase OsmC/OhrA